MKKRSKADANSKEESEGSTAKESATPELPDKCTVAEALLTTGTTYEDLAETTPDTPPETPRAKFVRFNTGSQIPEGYFDSHEAEKTEPLSSNEGKEEKVPEKADAGYQPQDNTRDIAGTGEPGTPEAAALRKIEQAEEAQEIKSEDGKRVSVCCQDTLVCSCALNVV